MAGSHVRCDEKFIGFTLSRNTRRKLLADAAVTVRSVTVLSTLRVGRQLSPSWFFLICISPMNAPVQRRAAQRTVRCNRLLGGITPILQYTRGTR
jgi:hypothetical protein